MNKYTNNQGYFKFTILSTNFKIPNIQDVNECVGLAILNTYLMFEFDFLHDFDAFW